MIAKINIHGQIGPSYVDGAGLFHKGTQLLDVIEQAESQDADEFEVSINSPGGYADIGDSIYDYLVSLKKKGKVTTIQNGLVGSIATKIFLAGDERIADERYQFWIHNPYLDGVSGDQDQLREMAKGLEETESNLRTFYKSFTQISEEGLDALMKQETGLNADQCIKFGFATGKKKVPVLNLIKPQMKDESLKDQILSLLGVKKGVQPKAQVKNMVVNLAEGAGSFWIEGESLSEGANAFLLDENGQPTAEPLADGDYPLEDGSVVSVSGGKVSNVMAPEAKKDEEMFTKEQAEAMIKAAVEKALSESEAKLNEVKAELKKESDDKIIALKKDIKLGIQPKPGVMKAPEMNFGKPISQVMAEKREERKKQLKTN